MKGNTLMAEQLEYPFGTVNAQTAARWITMAPDEDGHVWMLNLMKYRPVADYGDGTTSTITGKEADDIYAPTAVLDDLGATVPLFGDVTGEVADVVAWERIGIVRYPTRASFFAMQNREDFQKQYVHKEAGMETTIVMGCTPLTVGDRAEAGTGPIVMRVRRFHDGATPGTDPSGVVPIAHFAVDGVIIGDGRVWHDVRFDRADEATTAALANTEGVAEQVIVVINPFLEDLIGSVQTAEA